MNSTIGIIRSRINDFTVEFGRRPNVIFLSNSDKDSLVDETERMTLVDLHPRDTYKRETIMFDGISVREAVISCVGIAIYLRKE